MEQVVVGQDVVIGPEVTVRPGVIIPTNWQIPGKTIVNDGRNSVPVIVAKTS